MKNSKKGISLIVLVITIIVIIILAAAVILTLNNNNPIAEANDARYSSDVANMQAILTNTVAKIMAANQSTVILGTTTAEDGTVTAGGTTTITDSNLEATITYTLDYPMDEDNATGTIAFKAGTNTIPTTGDDAGVLTEWVTGKALPNYTSGAETWTIDADGNLSLTTANGKTYPSTGTN